MATSEVATSACEALTDADALLIYGQHAACCNVRPDHIRQQYEQCPDEARCTCGFDEVLCRVRHALASGGDHVQDMLSRPVTIMFDPGRRKVRDRAARIHERLVKAGAQVEVIPITPDIGGRPLEIYHSGALVREERRIEDFLAWLEDLAKRRQDAREKEGA